MLLFLIKGRHIIQLVLLPVDAHAHEARLARVLQHLEVLALAPADHGGKDLQPGALGQGQQGIGHLVNRLLLDLLAALGTVRDADARVQEAQVIVNLRHRADCRARVVSGRLLVDRDGGRQPLDGIHIGLFHLTQKLAGIGRHALHIAPLPLRVDGIEGQRRLAGARQAREYNKLFPGQRERYIFEVMLPRPFDDNLVLHILPPGIAQQIVAHLFSFNKPRNALHHPTR